MFPDSVSYDYVLINLQQKTKKDVLTVLNTSELYRLTIVTNVYYLKSIRMDKLYNYKFSADLVTFTEEILNGKLHFL